MNKIESFGKESNNWRFIKKFTKKQNYDYASLKSEMVNDCAKYYVFSALKWVQRKKNSLSSKKLRKSFANGIIVEELYYFKLSFYCILCNIINFRQIVSLVYFTSRKLYFVQPREREWLQIFYFLFGTGSHSTFAFPSRVNLSCPSLYCIARTLGK